MRFLRILFIRYRQKAMTDSVRSGRLRRVAVQLKKSALKLALT